MDEIFLRFGHIGYRILISLDCQSLANLKEVSRSWNRFIEEETLAEFSAIKEMTNASDESIRKRQKQYNAEGTSTFAVNIHQMYHVWKLARSFGDPICWDPQKIFFPQTSSTSNPRKRKMICK